MASLNFTFSPWLLCKERRSNRSNQASLGIYGKAATQFGRKGLGEGRSMVLASKVWKYHGRDCSLQ